MTTKGMLLLSLLLGVNLVDGSRIQADAPPGTKKKFVQTSGTCKAWCMKQAVGFPLDIDLLQKQANEKCHTTRGMKECKDCKGGGLTIPDCREEVMPQQETQSALEATNVAEKEEDEEVVQLCAKGGDYSTQFCSFQEGEICSHITEGDSFRSCPRPSRNAGDSFRNAGKPLCCSAEDDTNMEDVAVEVKAVVEALEIPTIAITEKDADPAPPVPQCAVGHSFKVASFQRNGNTVNMCRDAGTGRFAKKVCCDAATFKLLEDKQKAEDICSEEVKKAHCNVDVNTFENKRKKYRSFSETFTCKRMYFCVYQGKEKFGPVANHAWCRSEKTGLEGHRSAESTCVAVKAPGK